MVTAKKFHEMAMSLEGTIEAPHFDRVAYKVAKIFATLAPDKKTVNFKFTPDEQEFRCMMNPEAFSPVPNNFANHGWTTATLSKLKVDELRPALEAAWSQAKPKAKKKRKKA